MRCALTFASASSATPAALPLGEASLAAATASTPACCPKASCAQVKRNTLFARHSVCSLPRRARSNPLLCLSVCGDLVLLTACLRHLNRRMDPDFKASSADKFLVKVQAYTGFTQLINSFEVTPHHHHHHHHDTTHSAVVISAANSHTPPYITGGSRRATAAPVLRDIRAPLHLCWLQCKARRQM